MTLANAIRGQRIVMPLSPGGILDRTFTGVLLRAEDDRVDVWNVVLAPITTNQVGESIDGQVARDSAFFAGQSGGIFCEMTWGGGGVSFRTRFTYPVNGATFAVAGQNVMMTVGNLTILGGFTEQNRPAVEGWCMPRASPTAPEPLVQTFGGPFAAPIPILPWTRAVWVSKDTVGATCLVTFAGATIAAVTMFIPVQLGVQRIAVPTGAETVTVIPSAGTASIGMEMVFT